MKAATSEFGTFRTSRHVRLESEVRPEADVRRQVSSYPIIRPIAATAG
jgi:hypothetical protein